MLDVGHYDGTGCVPVFPYDQAPPNADWTPYCDGECFCPDGSGGRFRGGRFIGNEPCRVYPADRPWPSNVRT